MGDAVLERTLLRWQFVIASEVEGTLRTEGENCVSAPVSGITRQTLGTGSATPLVGEDDRGAIVVERRRVPVGHIRIAHFRDSLRIHRVSVSSRIPLPEHAPAASPIAG